MAGAFYTLVVAIFGSLWPAIALHALIELGDGTMASLALREGLAPRKNNPRCHGEAG
jgi:membrane protease YdiL (CAAX protease family)